MNRRIRVAILALFLGGLFSVAVALAHALILPVNISLARSERIYSSNLPHWEVDVLSRRGGVMVISRAWNSKTRQPGASDDAPSWSISSSPPSPQDCAIEREVGETAYGWPMMCLHSRGYVGRDNLPLIPIWDGILINSLVFAIPASVVVTGLTGLRGRSRIKHGLCPACAYPVGESAICTECGKPVRKHKAQPPTQKAQTP